MHGCVNNESSKSSGFTVRRFLTTCIRNVSLFLVDHKEKYYTEGNLLNGQISYARILNIFFLGITTIPTVERRQEL